MDCAFTATSHNITGNPQFAGSFNADHPFSLWGSSPCVDAGSNGSTTEQYDIRGAGYPRKLDRTSGTAGTIDIGAYEYLVSADPLPVELASFTAVTAGTTTLLAWKTMTEENNFGFEVERKAAATGQSDACMWQKIGFVQGAGTSSAPKDYTFTDATISFGRYAYRLKQVDSDGASRYSHITEVEFGAPKEYALVQNYPNPFNPSTKIDYSLPEDGFVLLQIFNIAGQLVKTAVACEMKAGYHTYELNADNLSNGIYFYRMDVHNNHFVKKFVLIK